jgi:mRNA interferase MazF
MAATIKTSVSIPKTLFDQTEILVQRLHVSRSHLFEIAIEGFIRNYESSTLFDDSTKTDQVPPSSDLAHQDTTAAAQIGDRPLVINQGDIYWMQLDDPDGVEPGIPHPYVVVQDNVFNHSRISSVVVCALTSNIKRASLPGNLLLEAGEANLPRPSVVEASKVSAVDKTQLGEYIGTLTGQRTDQILAGMRFLQLSFFAR